MPVEKSQQVRFAAIEKIGNHECEKSREQQKNHDENIRDRRRKIAGDFAFRDGHNIAKTVAVHFAASCFVSGIVMLRKTSSSRPSSVRNSEIFQFSFAASSPIAPASSRDDSLRFGKARTDFSSSASEFFTSSI